MRVLPILNHPSPNHGPRPPRPIDMLVLHYTGMESGAAALTRLCDPTAQVSAHYLVEEDGRIYALVDESRRAWHAGLSHWRGEGDANSRSIGIEIVNGGHDYGLPAYPDPQIDALIELCLEIVKRHPTILPTHILGHSDIAPTRKDDPGERFPWQKLAKAGLGLWPFDRLEPAFISDALAWQGLKEYGYDLNDPSAALRAFQRRFHPQHITGQWSPLCKARLVRLLESQNRNTFEKSDETPIIPTPL